MANKLGGENLANWEHFQHLADVGIRGRGANVSEAFAMAASAMTAIVTDIEKVSMKESFSIISVAPDLEMLLCRWLNDIIYEMDTRQMLFSRFIVDIKGTGEHGGHTITSEIWGEKVDVAKHEPAVEVKGATLTELKVYRDGEEWVAQCVVDV